MENPMKQKGIRDFFGINEPFFKTDELKSKNIRRFAARKDNLLDLKIAVELNQNYAVRWTLAKTFKIKERDEEKGGIIACSQIFFIK